METYKSMVRATQDKTWNDASTIASREDSLDTTRNNNSIVGLSTKQQIRKYEDQIEQCTVVAPIDGMITAVGVVAGDPYTGANPVVVIDDMSEYMISSEISEYDILKVKEGQKVRIRTRATADEVFDGTVVEIAPKASAQTNVASTDVTYNVKISFDTKGVELKFDMSCIMEIIVNDAKSVYAVPTDAIVTDVDGSEYIIICEEDYVVEKGDKKIPELGDDRFMKTDDDGTVVVMKKKHIKITRGLATDIYTEIRSSELKDGMVVLLDTEVSETMMPDEAVEEQGQMGGI